MASSKRKLLSRLDTAEDAALLARALTARKSAIAGSVKLARIHLIDPGKVDRRKRKLAVSTADVQTQPDWANGPVENPTANGSLTQIHKIFTPVS